MTGDGDAEVGRRPEREHFGKTISHACPWIIEPPTQASSRSQADQRPYDRMDSAWRTDPALSDAFTSKVASLAVKARQSVPARSSSSRACRDSPIRTLGQ
jgi:hypothetical protein